MHNRFPVMNFIFSTFKVHSSALRAMNGENQPLVMNVLVEFENEDFRRITEHFKEI